MIFCLRTKFIKLNCERTKKNCLSRREDTLWSFCVSFACKLCFCFHSRKVRPTRTHTKAGVSLDFRSRAKDRKPNAKQTNRHGCKANRLPTADWDNFDDLLVYFALGCVSLRDPFTLPPPPSPISYSPSLLAPFPSFCSTFPINFLLFWKKMIFLTAKKLNGFLTGDLFLSRIGPHSD